jgi:hypothetical protein
MRSRVCTPSQVWRPDKEAGGAWVCDATVGEHGGLTLGFYGGTYTERGEGVIAHGMVFAERLLLRNELSSIVCGYFTVCVLALEDPRWLNCEYDCHDLPLSHCC